MKYYLYDQNNSGGSFEVDHTEGISVYVIIAARSTREADQKAEDLGLYFDGCETDRDCSCCGDRWYSADEYDAKPYPHIHGTKLKDYVSTFKWEDIDVYVHYYNGTIEGWSTTKEKP